jgi:hypothetical protein
MLLITNQNYVKYQKIKILDVRNISSKKIDGFTFLFHDFFLIFPDYGEVPLLNASKALLSGVELVDKQEVVEKCTAFSKTFANPDGSTIFWQNGDMKR